MSKDNYEYKRRSSSLKRSRTSSKRSRSDSTHREDSIKYRTRSRSRSNRNRSPVPRHSENYRPNPIENPDRQNPTRNNILAVFGLDREVTERDLYYMYKNFGCKQCKVIIDKKTGRPRGFGFVYFNNIQDARDAKHATHGKRLLRREIRVDYSIGEKDYDQNKRHHETYSNASSSFYSSRYPNREHGSELRSHNSSPQQIRKHSNHFYSSSIASSYSQSQQTPSPDNTHYNDSFNSHTRSRERYRSDAERMEYRR